MNVVSKEPSGTVILGESSNTLKSNVATKTTTTTVKPPAPEKPVPAVTKPQLSEKLCASQEKPSAQKENAKVKTGSYSSIQNLFLSNDSGFKRANSETRA